jgi:hypothetical protein
VDEWTAIARLRVALVSGRLPPDLGRWLLLHVGRSVDRAERLRRRDEALRASASLLEGSDWRKARTIHGLLLAMRANPRLAEAAAGPPGAAADYVAQAFLIDRVYPASWRQVHRIIRTGDTNASAVTRADRASRPF